MKSNRTHETFSCTRNGKNGVRYFRLTCTYMKLRCIILAKHTCSYMSRFRQSDPVKRVVRLLEAASEREGEHHAHPHQHRRLFQVSPTQLTSYHRTAGRSEGTDEFNRFIIKELAVVRFRFYSNSSPTGTCIWQVLYVV